MQYCCLYTYDRVFFFQIENKELRDLLLISKGSVSVKTTATEESNQPADAAAEATTVEEEEPSQTECKE